MTRNRGFAQIFLPDFPFGFSGKSEAKALNFVALSKL